MYLLAKRLSGRQEMCERATPDEISDRRFNYPFTDFVVHDGGIFGTNREVYLFWRSLAQAGERCTEVRRADWFGKSAREDNARRW